MPSFEFDHVVPSSVLQMYSDIGVKPDPRRILLVPCCRECNSILGATVQETLHERKQYLKDRLKQKHKKLLESPDWAEDELSSLGPTLRGAVERFAAEKLILRQRIAW